MDHTNKKAFEYDGESSNTTPHEENLAGSPNNTDETHKDDRAEAAGRGSHFGEAFWFDPDGKMFEVKDDHTAWANQHKQELRDEYGLNIADPSRLVYEMLDSGWVRAMRTPSELSLTVGNLIDTPSIVEEIIDGLYDPSKDVIIGDQTESVRIGYPEKSIIPQVKRQLSKLVANASEDDRARTWLINTFLDRDDKGLEIAELAGWFQRVSSEIGIPDDTLMETYKSMVEKGHIEEKDGYAFLKSASGAMASPDMYSAAEDKDNKVGKCPICGELHYEKDLGAHMKFEHSKKASDTQFGRGDIVEGTWDGKKYVILECDTQDARIKEVGSDLGITEVVSLQDLKLISKKASDVEEPSAAEFGAGEENPNQLTFWDERSYPEKYPMMAKYPQLVDQIIELIRKYGDNEYKVEQDIFYASPFFMMNLSHSVGSPEGYKLIREVYQWLRDYQKANEGKGYTDIQLKESSIPVEGIVRKTPDKNEWCVYSHKGKSLGCYSSKAKAEHRLQQVEYFKHHGSKESLVYKGLLARYDDGVTYTCPHCYDHFPFSRTRHLAMGCKGSKEISMHKEAQAPVTLLKVEQKGAGYLAEAELPRSATRHHDLRQLNKFLKTWATENFASDLGPAIQQQLGIEGPFAFDENQTEFYPNVGDDTVTFDVRFAIAQPAEIAEDIEQEGTMEWRPAPRLATKTKVLVRGKYDERTNDFKVKVGEGAWQRFSSETSLGDRLSRVSDELAAEAFIDEMKMSVGRTIDAVLIKTAAEITNVTQIWKVVITTGNNGYADEIAQALDDNAGAASLINNAHQDGNLVIVELFAQSEADARSTVLRALQDAGHRDVKGELSFEVKKADDNTTEWETSRQYLGFPGNPQGPGQVQAEALECDTCGHTKDYHTDRCRYALCDCPGFKKEKKTANDTGPSDEDVNAKAWEMFHEHWNALSSSQQDQVYKALGVTASQKKQASTEGDVISFWVPSGPLEDKRSLVQLWFMDGHWEEGQVLEGEEPKNWGSKTYMGYLTPKDLEEWLANDYGFAEIEEIDMAEPESLPPGTASVKKASGGSLEVQIEDEEGNEKTITVEYDYTRGSAGITSGPPDNWSPPDPGEIDVTEMFWIDGEKQLTKEEFTKVMDRWGDYIYEKIDDYENDRDAEGSQKIADAWEACDNCGGTGEVEGRICPGCEGAGKFLVRKKADSDPTLSERYEMRKKDLERRLREANDPATRMEIKEDLEALEQYAAGKKTADERPPAPAKETAGPGMKWVYRESDGQWTQVPETDDQGIVPVKTTEAYETTEMEEELRNYIRETARPNREPQSEARRVTEMIYDSFHGEDMLDYIENSIGNEYDLRLYVEDVLTDEEDEGTEVQSMAGRDCPQCGTHLEKENPNDEWKCNCGWQAG